MSRRKRYSTSVRDSGGFAAIPWAVLDSPAYQSLSHPARSLLMEVARQFHGDDNGRMLLSRHYLAKRGWKSNDTIQRAKEELIEAGFIYQTVMGMKPWKASWYAVTWLSMDRLDGFDPGASAGFERSAYLKGKTQSLSRQTGQQPA